MKTKKTRKKLALNKISIARLDKDIIKHAKGGGEVVPTEKPPQCTDAPPPYSSDTGDGCTEI